jgi:hypothetical protein
MTSLLDEYAAIMDRVSEVQPAPHRICLASVITTAIGRRAWIDYGVFKEYTPVSCLLVGLSGSGKTTAARSSIETARAAMRGLEAPRLKTVTIGHASDRGLHDQLRPTKEEKDDPPAQLVFWDEIGSILTGDEWIERTRRTLIHAMNGRLPAVATARDKLEEADATLGLIATVTSTAMRTILDRVAATDGFLGRFVTIPVIPNGHRLSVPQAISGKDAISIEKIQRRIRDIAQSRDVIGPLYDRFTPAAHENREAWYDTWKTRIEAGDDEVLASMFTRGQATASRLALGIAVAAVTNYDLSLSVVDIDEEHVDQAQRIIDESIATVCGYVSEADQHPVDQAREKVLTALRRAGNTGVMLGELSEISRTRKVSRSVISELVTRQLYEEGMVRYESVKTKTRTGIRVWIVDEQHG